jgi:hypothetical protein
VPLQDVVDVVYHGVNMDYQRPVELDLGVVLDGEVREDPQTNHLLLIEEDGSVFPLEERLRILRGQKIRITFIRMESMKALEKLMI